MELEELNVYKIAMKLGEEIWRVVDGWNSFEKNTIGYQLTRSSDSIGANIAEGFGRYHFKENKNFLYYARCSLFETKTWIRKTNNRELLPNNDFEMLNEQLTILSVKLNNCIKSIGKIK